LASVSIAKAGAECNPRGPTFGRKN
jgi:hypothetical protein